MPLIQLARSRWQEFFDATLKAVTARTAKVEVRGPGLGDRIAADWISLAVDAEGNHHVVQFGAPLELPAP